MIGMEFLRCFEMRESVISDQVLKWPQLMARKNVDGMGLKNVLWRNAARSNFVWCVVMAICAIFKMWEL